MSSLLDDAGIWDQRSQEAHDMAARVTDPDMKVTLLRIAAGFARMAAQARQQAMRGTNQHAFASAAAACAQDGFVA